MIENLCERNKKIKDMRLKEGKKLCEIAEAFNISRERVRQIIGNTGTLRKWTEDYEKDLSNTTTEEVYFLPGCVSVWKKRIGDIHHKNNSLGAKSEELAVKILQENGFKEPKAMPFDHPFDIEVNGIRIDVKHSDCDISKCPSQKHPGHTYQIGHLKNGKDCDLFFVLIHDIEEPNGYASFIIPSDLASCNNIRIPWPKFGRKSSKWHQYYNRFDLLKSRIENRIALKEAENV